MSQELLHLVIIVIKIHGRVTAQAGNLRLPSVAARVRAQVISCGIYGGQIGTRVGFLRVFRFPLLILIPPTAQHSSSIIRGWYNRPISGRQTKWAQFHPAPRNTTRIQAGQIYRFRIPFPPGA
jgi:hypothetical protein